MRPVSRCDLGRRDRGGEVAEPEPPACGGAITALTTWWSGPNNAQYASAFEPGHFDTQGIVPVGYAVFANVTGSFTPLGQAWVLAQGAVSKTGLVVPIGWGDLYNALPASCQTLLPGSPTSKSGASLNAVFSCMLAHGWRGFATYQPASRYWPFQGIETGIYVLLAAALIAVTFVIVRRRDA